MVLPLSKLINYKLIEVVGRCFVPCIVYLRSRVSFRTLQIKRNPVTAKEGHRLFR